MNARTTDSHLHVWDDQKTLDVVNIKKFLVDYVLCSRYSFFLIFQIFLNDE